MAVLSKEKMNVVISTGVTGEEKDYHRHLETVEAFLGVTFDRLLTSNSDPRLLLGGENWLVLNDNWVTENDKYIYSLRTGQYHKILLFGSVELSWPIIKDGRRQWGNRTKYSCVQVEKQEDIRLNDKVVAISSYRPIELLS